MILNYIFKNFVQTNFKLLFTYIILNLLIYPLEVLGLSRLYSKLISESNNIKKLKIPYIPDIFSEKSYNNPSIEILLIYIFIILVTVSIIDRVRNYCYAIIYPKFQMWTRNEMFKKTLDKYNTNFEDIKIGKQIIRMEDIIFTFQEIYKFVITDGIALVIISLILIVYLYTKNLKLLGIFLIYLITYILILVLVTKKIKNKIFKRVDNYYSLNNNIDNSLTNLSNLLSNNQNKYEVKKTIKYSNKFKNDSENISILKSNYIWLLRSLNILNFVFIIGFAYFLSINKNLSKIDFITIIIIMIYYVGLVSNQNLNIISCIDRLCQMKYQASYLKNLLLNNNDQNNIKNNITNGKIEFRNLTYKYPKSNKSVIRNLNFTILPKQKVAILGKSGSGKSTLMKLLIKFYKPNNGKIFIDDTNIQNIDTTYLRDNITYINQNTLLFDEDIYYNIKYGSKQSINLETIAPAPSPNHQPLTNLTPSPSNKVYPKEEILEDSKIEKILKKYDLLTIYDKLENKLREKAGPRGTKLSLGMQKVTITLRGILRKSKIIIFDEPLAGLDQKTREKIIKLIMNETKDKTVIIITHDKEILPYMDKTINLQEINNN